LAGVAFVPSATDDPAGALAINVGALVRILKSLRGPRAAGVLDPVVLVIGSGEQYGQHPASEQPLLETAECRPHNFYAATKMAQEAIALAAFRAEGAKVIATRSFNHAGPGQAPSFLLPSLVTRALAARRNGTEVPIGNTDVTRDLLHVEDVVAAYISLAGRGVPGEVYNVCGGEGVQVGALATEVLAQAGLTTPWRVDPALQRAVDVPMLVGSNAKLRSATGWTPRRSRADIISDLLASLDAAS
jgi:GDP-4-dehydro-6-deoxy-D-mannose reductase